MHKVISKDTQSDFYTKESQQTKDTMQKEELANCRICFQEMDLSQVPNICKCKPQHNPIHQKCLSDWIHSASIHEEGFFKYYIKCTLCKNNIYLTTKTTYSLLPLRKVDFWRKELCCTVFLIIFLLIGIGMIGMSLMLLQNAPSDELVKIVAYSSIVVGAILIILDVLSFLYLAMVSKKVQPTGIVGLRLEEKPAKQNPQIQKYLQSPSDSYAKLSFQITSQQTLEDVIDC